MKRILNMLLLVSFAVTVMVPLTGVMIHKLASVLFLLLCLVHTAVYWKKMNGKRAMMLGAVLVSFLSGILGMILDHIPAVMALHKAISIALVFFLAIHIFVFHKKLRRG